MRKRLTRIGSSLGVIIDKPILSLLKITPETELEIETDGRDLILRPVRTLSESETMEIHERVAKRHAASFAQLAGSDRP
ncbi:MAG: AbrB/MazE/SpoVT family DNA-binding domain-containing protein [Armatimonadota bacterium]